MDTPVFRHAKVMVIDDNPLDRLIVSRICHTAAFAAETLEMGSAEEALDYLGRCADSAAQLPEVILLDISMPVMDGFGFLQHFRSLPASIHEAVNIYLLTSSVDPFDQERAAANPFVLGLINKPLTKQKLDNIL